MRTKSKDRRRDEVRYEQLILELPLPPPPSHVRPPLPGERVPGERAAVDSDERDRGVVTIELY